MLQVQSCFRSSHSHPPKTIVGQEHCMFLTQQNPCHVILGWPPSIEIQHELSGWGFWTLCWSKSFHVAGQHTTPWIVRDAHSNLALRVWKALSSAANLHLAWPAPQVRRLLLCSGSAFTLAFAFCLARALALACALAFPAGLSFSGFGIKGLRKNKSLSLP